MTKLKKQQFQSTKRLIYWLFFPCSLQMLTALIEDTFSSTIDFLNRKCQPILSADLPASISSNYRIVDGIQEVSSFLRILSALCDKFLVHEEEGSDTDSPVTGRFNFICLEFVLMRIFYLYVQIKFPKHHLLLSSYLAKVSGLDILSRVPKVMGFSQKSYRFIIQC